MSEDWTEKYRPRTLRDVVGNPKAVDQLVRWAESWQSGKPKKKAVILRGNPGIGKTTAALALANDFGWGLIEMNASDKRNADAIKRIALTGSLGETFSDTGEFLTTKENRRKLIVLDEADNVFGREDYGGINAIVVTIKGTKQPIILIVNDYYNLTRRSSVLASLCLTISFNKVSKPSMRKRLKEIAQAEGVSISLQALDAIIQHSNGDMRSAINDFQALASGRTKVSENDVNALGYRDARNTIFNALTEIFKTTKCKKSREATFSLDEDPEYIILWIDENLPQEYRDPLDLMTGYDALAKADVYLGRVRRRRHYGLWSYANDMMTCGVSLGKSRRYSGYTKFRFPLWLSMMSRTKGIRGVRESLAGKIGRHCHASRAETKNEILPYFKMVFKLNGEFRTKMCLKLNLNEEEIAFLLDEKPDSHPVRHLVDSLKKSKEGTTEEEVVLFGHLEEKEETKEEVSKEEEKESVQKSLFEF